MWYRLGKFILKFRLVLLIGLLLLTSLMGYYASRVRLSYDFSKAIPVDNPKYLDYESFKNRFGDDGNSMVMGLQSKDFFSLRIFNALDSMEKNLKKIRGVESVMSVPAAVNLVRNDSLQKFQTVEIFHAPYSSQAALDSDRNTFLSLPFYNRLLYNTDSSAYAVELQLNKNIINSKSRTSLINAILVPIHAFENSTGLAFHISGLPYIRTTIADRLARELNLFLLGSFLLSALVLLLFFRSFSAMLMSLGVVAMGVVWSLATMVFLGYKITLLTALIPPLVVVIGIPNCIYFLNKYHTSYRETKNKNEAIITMIGRMGIVTLFCNIAAAIGFAVFALTRSALLKEFGEVSGINILGLFLISLIFIPVILSYLPPPREREVKYLENKLFEHILLRMERWTFHHARWVYLVSAIVVVFSIFGMLRLKSEGFIVDDLPKNDAIYTDLKWFEANFNGVMPLDIEVDTKKKDGLFRSLSPLNKINEFSKYIAAQPETAKPLSLADGMKFAKQAFYGGDSESYALPTEFEIPLMRNFLKTKTSRSAPNVFDKLVHTYVDSSKQIARISVSMKDIGSAKLPVLLNKFQQKAAKIFDTANYRVTFTGASVTFLEGTSFIIRGLKESIFWAFILIAFCMLYLFRSLRILLCSLIPNLIPLMATAGVMGWLGITLKPSTVLIFSIALGIAIDVTIRFLVNYKQELPHYQGAVKPTLEQTIRHTGISIIYTSLVLIAGFIIFCMSHFGGTRALGWLTSLTLVMGTLTNLALLPVLIYSLRKRKQ